MTIANDHIATNYTIPNRFFENVQQIKFEGPSSTNPLSYQYYDKDRMVLGKRMEEHLRMAVCYWHTFCWNGVDMFGAPASPRPWQEGSSPREAADNKMAAAFEFISKLDVPYYTFHDIDVVEPSPTSNQLSDNLRRATDKLAEYQALTGRKLLWGTANLTTHSRYAAGALTNPNHEIVACAARQVRDCLNATHQLGGANYVLWGGREGYDTLLNTNLIKELDQYGRFLSLIVEHKHKIGFKGKIMIEPKPHEPAYHMYDFDTATIYGFLEKYDLVGECHVNIEPNHSTLSGHSFAHEIATAVALNVMGSIDINCGNYQNGWDTDQFNLDIKDMTNALLELLPTGGLTTGGFNFDAKVRRQSTDLIDLFYAHIGGIDALARALLSAEKLIRDGVLSHQKYQRYDNWGSDLGMLMLDGKATLDSIADYVKDNDLKPEHSSGRQEFLENIVNRSLV